MMAPPSSSRKHQQKKTKRALEEEEEEEEEEKQRQSMNEDDGDEDDDDMEAVVEHGSDDDNADNNLSKQTKKRKKESVNVAARSPARRLLLLPHKQKGVDDALKDLKASFSGVNAGSQHHQNENKRESSKTGTTSASSSVKGRSTPSLLNRHAAFKISFGEQASTSTSTAATGSASKHPSNGGATISSRNNANASSTSTTAKRPGLPIVSAAENSTSNSTTPGLQKTPVRSAIRSHPGSSFLDSFPQTGSSSSSYGTSTRNGAHTTTASKNRSNLNVGGVGDISAASKKSAESRPINTRDKGKGRAIVTVEDAESNEEEEEEEEEQEQAMRERDQEEAEGSRENGGERRSDANDAVTEHQDPARDAHGGIASGTRKRGSRGTSITSLSDLSARKHFKILNTSTPSRPSPLRYDTPLNSKNTTADDVKPLKTLGAISGLNAVSNTTSIAIADATISAGAAGDGGVGQNHRESTALSERKPRWAQLLEGSAGITRITTPDGTSPRDGNNISATTRLSSTASVSSTAAQDLTELLSPRKKRKGWVPAGHAELAAATIKRLQTGSNLWIHEISRTLATFSGKAGRNKNIKSEDGSASASKGAVATSSSGKSYDDLLRDLNPHLRLQILDIYSSKPASLTWTSSEGGFITAGAAEKLLITRCKILKDEETEQGLLLLTGQDAVDTERGGRTRGSSPTPASQTFRANASSHSRLLPGHAEAISPPTPTASAEAEAGGIDSWAEEQVEGLVIFSLAGHSRTSTGVTLARKEQRRPSRAGDDDDNNDGNTAANPFDPGQPQANQPLLNFEKAQENDRKKRVCTVFVPASISDLHMQMRVEDEIWVWEPWSAVDLAPDGADGVSALLTTVDPAQNGTLNATSQHQAQSNERALLVSRFGIVL